MFKAFLFYNDNDKWDVASVVLISADLAEEAS